MRRSPLPSAWTVTRAGPRGSVVLPGRGVRRARAVAGAAGRAAGGGPRRQAHQGGARAGARARPGPARCALRHRSLQVPTRMSRRRSPGSCGSCCCCPAATGTRGCATCCSRANGALLRGEADYQLHWIYLWYEEQPQRGARRCCSALHARYPRNPLFAAAHRRGRGAVPPRSGGQPRHVAGTAGSGRRRRVHAAPLAATRARLGSAERLDELYETDRAARARRRRDSPGAASTVRRARARTPAARTVRSAAGPADAGARCLPCRHRCGPGARSRTASRPTPRARGCAGLPIP